ncbi:enoyl-CoA hydratase [Mycolicibacterium setense]|uniref:enoyl-CoA hydratase/isomerase family protein n=1 Tax=Mycolicibacterium setense TaxID=431269 RepID=UPI0007EBA6C1|nr:enoyl-CoA hydratase/isomerase family protein [Mycolicibacterium setense]OBB14642.1 enoyl-CoA hydratase [Mycolicibacterium setense]
MLQKRFGDIEVNFGDDHVAVVEIQRPPNNFFDVPLIGAIADAFTLLDGISECRAIVLAAQGKHFCAGALFQPGESSSPVGGPDVLYGEAVRLMQSTKPVVAAVHGGAIGGGLGLACAADFRVAAPEARFTSNFAQLGFHHGFGLTLTLPRIVGNQAALDLMYTGRRIGGDRAAEIGLVDRLVPLAKVRSTAIDFAREIAASAPLAVQSIRKTMRGDLAEAFRAATTHEGEQQIWLRATDDFKEGVQASAERRPPRFQAR